MRRLFLIPGLRFLPLQGTVSLCWVLSETSAEEKRNRAGTLKRNVEKLLFVW